MKRKREKRESAGGMGVKGEEVEENARGRDAGHQSVECRVVHSIRRMRKVTCMRHILQEEE
jgi:hypothetical protein